MQTMELIEAPAPWGTKAFWHWADAKDFADRVWNDGCTYFWVHLNQGDPRIKEYEAIAI